MSLLNTSSFLGIAVGEQSLTVAELSAAAGGGGGAGDKAGPAWEVRRIAEMPLPASSGADADWVDQVGRDLGKFLKQNKFSASRAVVGIPARWLVTREKELPPASREQANDILRLQAERLFSSELKDLVFDYAGKPDPSQPRKVLLMAVPRRQLDRIVGAVEGAGLNVKAVVPSTVALGTAAAGGTDDGLLLSLSAEAVELQSRGDDGAPGMLRHLQVKGPDPTSTNGTRTGAVASLAREVKRVVTMTPGLTSRAVALWDGIGLTADETTALRQQTGLEIRRSDGLHEIGVRAPLADAGDRRVGRHGPAVALAMLGPTLVRGGDVDGGAPVDFLHSRLAPPKPKRLSKAAKYGILGAVVAIAGIGLLVWDVNRVEGELAGLNDSLKSMEGPVKESKALIDRVDAARPWFEDRPHPLEVMLAVTDSFLQDDNLYLTSFVIRDNKVTIGGRAPDQSTIYAMRDRLMKNPQLADTKLLDSREAGGQSRDWMFSIGFTFAGDAKGGKTPASASGAVVPSTTRPRTPAPPTEVRATPPPPTTTTAPTPPPPTTAPTTPPTNADTTGPEEDEP